MSWDYFLGCNSCHHWSVQWRVCVCVWWGAGASVVPVAMPWVWCRFCSGSGGGFRWIHSRLSTGKICGEAGRGWNLGSSGSLQLWWERCPVSEGPVQCLQSLQGFCCTPKQGRNQWYSLLIPSHLLTGTETFPVRRHLLLKDSPLVS